MLAGSAALFGAATSGADTPGSPKGTPGADTSGSAVGLELLLERFRTGLNAERVALEPDDAASGDPDDPRMLRSAVPMQDGSPGVLLVQRGSDAPAFSDAERDVLGLRGLLPPHVCHQDEQVARVLGNFRRLESPLEKYIFMASLHDRHEALFFRIVMDNPDETMPIIHTPTVGLAGPKFGNRLQRTRGIRGPPNRPRHGRAASARGCAGRGSLGSRTGPLWHFAQ